MNFLKKATKQTIGIILGIIILGSQCKASCNITLYKKSATAKTSYTLSGESISKKVIEKLSSQCDFAMKLMSVEQKRTMDIARLKARLAKLGVK